MTAKQFLQLGMELAGFNRHQKISERTCRMRFAAWFCCTPEACSSCWNDLRTSKIDDVRLSESADPKHFMIALKFMKSYDTEAALAGTFECDEKTVRKWVWFYIEKISALRNEKVSQLKNGFLT